MFPQEDGLEEKSGGKFRQLEQNDATKTAYEMQL